MIYFGPSIGEIFFRKYFGYSIAKRPHVGEMSSKFFFKYLAIISALFLLIFGAGIKEWIICFFAVVLVSFLLGVFIQYRFQHIFVTVDIPFFLHYGTVSQTIIIASKSGKCYYFYRDFIGGTSNNDWKLFTFQKK